MHARGNFVLYLDADGATDYREIKHIYERVVKLASQNASNLACAIGNRNSSESEADRKGIRKFLNTCQNGLVGCVLKRQIADTQCGFKIFSRSAAQRIFVAQHLERWAFDIELLYLCHAQGIPIEEVPVKWEDKEGSKLNIIDASLQMGRDILLIKILYLTGIWNCQDMSW